MNAEFREYILNKLMNTVSEAKGEVTDESIKLTNAYFNCISKDIGEAIGEINDANAPFLIATLEMYAKDIRDRFPETIVTAEEIKSLPFISKIETKYKII